MTPRRLATIAVLLGATVLCLWWFGRRSSSPVAEGSRANSAPAVSPAPFTHAASREPSPTAVQASADPPAAAFDPADFPLAADLNAPGSTIARDLDILQQVFDAWRSNFPRDGNPVGENAEITAALTGDNPLGLALVPKKHPALNARGELCDRWGTPFRFHQLSGERMEVISAGPDREFATVDDAVWTPQ